MFGPVLSAAVIAIICFVPVAFGQSATSWQKAVSADGRFEALFPGSYTRSVKTVKTVEGKDALMTMYTSTVGNAAFFVTHTDYTYDLEAGQAPLLSAQGGFLKATAAELVSATPTVFQGYPARLVEARSPGHKVKFKVLSIVVGRRLYQIAAAHPEAEALPAQGRFFSSFRLTVPGSVARR